MHAKISDYMTHDSLASQQAELAERVGRLATVDGPQPSAIAGLTLIRASSPSQPLPSLYEPSLCIVVQGRKRAVLADEVYVYDALN